tara:strand:- start:1079 stop:2524 length:1446 start_codon:yes stop_codon:yes gene_type:complete
MSEYLKVCNLRSVLFGLFLSFGYVNLLNAQEDDEMALMEAAFNQDQASGAQDQLGQVCQDHMDKKGWQPVQTNKKGEEEYYIIGIGSVLAPIDSSAFVDSLQNGGVKALLNSKTNFAKTLSQEVTSDIISEVKSQYSEGKKPDLLQTENIDVQGKSYDDLSSFEKMKLLVTQQLDKLIDPETKEEFNAASEADNEAAQEAVRKLEDILNQETFQDTITVKSTADIRGMVVKFAQFTAIPKRGKSAEVCIVAKWSPGLVRMADAIATNDFEILQSKRKKSKLRDQLPDPKDFQGFKQLLGSFGVFNMIDQNGDVNLVSFAVAGMKTKSAASEASARRVAELKANRQIIQVLNEHVDLYSKTSNVESATEYKDGLTDYYTEQKDQSRAAASASATMSGIQTLFTYKGNHLLNRKPLVGVVTYYNASSSKGAKKAQDILAKAPEKTTKDEVEEDAASTYDATEPQDRAGLSTGAGYGDDEDDDF